MVAHHLADHILREAMADAFLCFCARGAFFERRAQLDRQVYLDAAARGPGEHIPGQLSLEASRELRVLGDLDAAALLHPAGLADLEHEPQLEVFARLGQPLITSSSGRGLPNTTCSICATLRLPFTWVRLGGPASPL
jgi:hypothetical protein